MTARSPVSRLKLNASSESRAVPDGQPAIDRPDSSATGATCIGSNAAPTISSLPRGVSEALHSHRLDWIGISHQDNRGRQIALAEFRDERQNPVEPDMVFQRPLA